MIEVELIPQGIDNTIQNSINSLESVLYNPCPKKEKERRIALVLGNLRAIYNMIAFIEIKDEIEKEE